MAKSKIIKELANGEVSLHTALKRVKVLLQEFDNEELLQWVNCELEGYPTDAELPNYRISQGQLKGTYFKGSLMSNATFKNVPLPLGKMEKDLKEAILTLKFFDGVEALKQMIEDRHDKAFGAPLPAEIYPKISWANNDPYMNIVSAHVEGSIQMVQAVLSAVESRLLDVLRYLEKEFGNLDELDIDVDSKEDYERNEIIQQIHVMIYNDNRISIGNDNKFKNTSIVSNSSDTNPILQ